MAWMKCLIELQCSIPGRCSPRPRMLQTYFSYSTSWHTTEIYREQWWLSCHHYFTTFLYFSLSNDAFIEKKGSDFWSWSIFVILLCLSGCVAVQWVWFSCQVSGLRSAFCRKVENMMYGTFTPSLRGQSLAWFHLRTQNECTHTHTHTHTHRHTHTHTHTHRHTHTYTYVEITGNVSDRVILILSPKILNRSCTGIQPEHDFIADYCNSCVFSSTSTLC